MKIAALITLSLLTAQAIPACAGDRGEGATPYPTNSEVAEWPEACSSYVPLEGCGVEICAAIPPTGNDDRAYWWLEVDGIVYLCEGTDCSGAQAHAQEYC